MRHDTPPPFPLYPRSSPPHSTAMDASAVDAIMVNNLIFAAELETGCVDTVTGRMARHAGPVSFEEVQSRYGRGFRRAARMSKPCFLRLVEIVRPYMKAHAVPLACQVFVSLRYYAGASDLDVCAATGVSRTVFYEIVWDFTDAVLCAPELKLRMPLWEAAWRERTAAGFQRRGNSPFANIIGALDGIAVRQEQPSVADVTCPKDYWCRKGFFSLNVQAICDANYEFLWVSCRTPGSSHDSMALACSELGQLLKDTRHPMVKLLIREGLCIAADEAYGDSEVLAVPWPGGGDGNKWRDGYNFYQSSARVHIEQAFGQLVWPWGIFWRPLRMPFGKRPLVIQVACMLHNLCRAHDGMPLSELGRGDTAYQALCAGIACPEETPRRQRGVGSQLRRRMTLAVQNSGRVRPPLHGE